MSKIEKEECLYTRLKQIRVYIDRMHKTKCEYAHNRKGRILERQNEYMLAKSFPKKEGNFILCESVKHYLGQEDTGICGES